MSTERQYLEQICDGMQWLVHSGFLKSFPVRLPSDLEERPKQETVQLLRRKSGRSTVYVTEGWAGQGDIIVKTYKPRIWMEFVKYLFTDTRATAEWKMNHLFRKIGVPSVLLLAWGEKRTLGIWRGSELVMEAVSPHLTLSEYLKNGVPREHVASILGALAKGVAALHDHGLHYRDLHGENVLLQCRKGKTPLVFFVDLHEVRHIRRIKRWMCVDDLGRLSAYVVAPTGMRIRFLKTYLAERGLHRDDWKAWAGDIDARTREIWDRNYRKRGTRIETY